MPKVTVIKECPIHLWFELSYAQYLTIPRSVMEAMPHKWKEKMAKLLDELDDTIDWLPEKGRYWCRLKDENGKFVHDPLMEYRRPEKGAIKFFDKQLKQNTHVKI